MKFPKSLRRILLPLLALAIGAAYYSYSTYHKAHTAALAVAVQSGQLNADGPQVAAAANTDVPPFGALTGKFAFGVGLFLAGLALAFVAQYLVVPVHPRWATDPDDGYSETFERLPDAEKVKENNKIWTVLVIYYTICMLAACLSI